MSKKKKQINPLIGTRLKELCRQTGITQQILSEKINLSQQTISKIVQGKSNLTRENAERICAIYPKFRISWLLGIDAEESMPGNYTDIEKTLDGVVDVSEAKEYIWNFNDDLIYEWIYAPQEYQNQNIAFITSPEGKTIALCGKQIESIINDIQNYTIQRLFYEIYRISQTKEGANDG